MICWIKNQNQKLKNLLKLSDPTSMVGLKNKRIEDILPDEIDKVEKAKLEKEMKLQNQHDQKEHLTHALQDIDRLWKSISEVEVIFWSKMKESEVKEILKNQIFFCEHNLVKIIQLTNIFRWGSQLPININPLIYKDLKPT